MDERYAVLYRVRGAGDLGRLAVKSYLPAVGFHDTAEYIHKRGLACAVFT